MLRIRGPIARSANTQHQCHVTHAFSALTLHHSTEMHPYQHLSSRTNEVQGSSQIIRDSLVVQQARKTRKEAALHVRVSPSVFYADTPPLIKQVEFSVSHLSCPAVG